MDEQRWNYVLDLLSLSLGLILSKSAGKGKLRHLPDKVKVYDYKICKASGGG